MIVPVDSIEIAHPRGFDVVPQQPWYCCSDATRRPCVRTWAPVSTHPTGGRSSVRVWQDS